MFTPPPTRPLTLAQTLLYSCASIGLNLMSVTVSTWLLYFWAPPPGSGRTQYLSVTLVGVLLTLGRVWDAIIDPVIGYWSDVTQNRWGRRRPFLLFATPVAALALVLVWTPPAQGSGLLNAVYFLGVTILFYTGLSLVGIPYDSSLAEMGDTATERLRLSMWKNILGVAGVLAGALVVGPLFAAVGPPTMGLVVGLMGLGTVWLTLLAFRERGIPEAQPLPIGESLRLTFRNQPFLILFASALLIYTAYAMLLADLPYFVTLVVGRGEQEVSLFQGVVVLLMVLSAPLWNRLARSFPCRYLLVAAMLGLAGTSALTFGVGLVPGVPLFAQALLTLALLGPFLGGYFVLVYAMMGSVVDYDAMLTGARREAIYYGAFSLAVGLGPSLAALVLPFIFERYGYTAVQPLGVRVVFLVTAFLALLGVFAFQGYQLGDTPAQTRQNLGMKDD